MHFVSVTATCQAKRFGLRSLLLLFSFCLVLGGFNPSVEAAPPREGFSREIPEDTVLEKILGFNISTPENECTCAPEFNFAPCCGTHDLAYEAGGDSNDRLIADQGLFNCIWSSGKPLMALIYYLAVRVFGWMFFTYYPVKPLKTKRRR
jgi:hypothetical protein